MAITLLRENSDIFNVYALDQVINEPTRYSDSSAKILDLIISSEKIPDHMTSVVDYGISDHYLSPVLVGDDCNNLFWDVIRPKVVFSGSLIKNILLETTGSIGMGNASGWMQKNELLIFINHFSRYTTGNKVLLLLDKQSTHISIQALDYCSEYFIVVLSFTLQHF